MASKPLEDLTCHGCASVIRTHLTSRRYCSTMCRIYSQMARIGKCEICGERDDSIFLAWMPTPESREANKNVGQAFALRHQDCLRVELDRQGRSLECPCAACERERGAPLPQKVNGYSRTSRREPNRYGQHREAVVVRDNWTCQICDLPIDPEAGPYEDRSLALDHITPRREGGSDEIDNLRATHRWCNAQREVHPFWGDDYFVRERARARFGADPS